MAIYKIDDIVPLQKLRFALDSISKASGMNLCMIDPLGDTIIYPCNDNYFCKKVRENPEFKKHCLSNASHSALESARERKPYYYRCYMGLIDFAIPIFYHGDYIGAICGGQIKTDKSVNPDCVYDEVSLAEYPELSKLKAEIPFTDAVRFIELSKLLLRLTEYLTHFGILIDFERNEAAEAVNNRSKLQPALIYVERNYNKKISLKELAALCYVSENYFSRMFSAIMKMSVSRYILDFRIKKAKELLEQGQLKIQAIAYETGFGDAPYFIRKFKQATGLTPREYQSMHSV